LVSFTKDKVLIGCTNAPKQIWICDGR
jgi:hypothetical protein